MDIARFLYNSLFNPFVSYDVHRQISLQFLIKTVEILAMMDIGRLQLIITAESMNI